MYSINFNVTKKKFCLSLHYNETNSYLFVNGTKIYKFKAKDSKIVPSPLHLENISKDWSIDNMKKTGFTGYVYDFSVDYNVTNIHNFKDIHKYLMKKMIYYAFGNPSCKAMYKIKAFRFVKQTFISAMMFFSYYLPTANSLRCIQMNYQSCKERPEIINVSSNNPVLYPFSIKASKCSGNCNNINDLCAKICVLDVVKNLNVKVLNLMSRTNEIKNIKWHDACKCECRLDAIVCNNKQRWNNDKCESECKELIHKGARDKDSIWHPSNCERECNKA